MFPFAYTLPDWLAVNVEMKLLGCDSETEPDYMPLLTCIASWHIGNENYSEPVLLNMVRLSPLPNIFQLLLIVIWSIIPTASSVLLTTLVAVRVLTVRSVADVSVGCFVASKLSVSVFVYVVAWFTFNASWSFTYVTVAFGVSKLSTSVLVYMLVAASDPDTVTVVDVWISVAVAEALAKKLVL